METVYTFCSCTATVSDEVFHKPQLERLYYSVVSSKRVVARSEVGCAS